MSISRCVAVGVEIGGGKTTVALIDQSGYIHQRCQAKTLRGRPALATLELYIRAIDTMLTYAQVAGFAVCGIGVSVPGTIDQTARRPVLIPVLPVLHNFPLSEFFETHYHLSTRLHADVDAAMLGQYRFGAGQNFRRLLFLTVNAVVGASFAIDGQLVASSQQYIGHVCHLSVSNSGPRCSCGKHGCINTLISHGALQKMVQRALRRGEQTSLLQRFLNHECFSPQLLAEEAVQGDVVASKIYHNVARWLSVALAQYVSLFDPNVLILGGTVLHSNDFLLTQVRSSLVSPKASHVCNTVEVLPSRLGCDAVLIGAVSSLF